MSQHSIDLALAVARGEMTPDAAVEQMKARLTKLAAPAENGESRPGDADQ